MQRVQPFRRFSAVLSAMAALMMPGADGLVQAATREQALGMVGGYKSNAKTGSKTHDRGGSRAFQRQALKRRNRQRNRLAHRG